MLFLLTRPIADQFILFNLFRYLTFRSGAACLTALILSLMFGPRLIRWLKSVQGAGQPIRPDGPERHVLEKQGTPTMGGRADPGHLVHLDLAVGGFAQPVCLGGDAADAGLRRIGFRR